MTWNRALPETAGKFSGADVVNLGAALPFIRAATAYLISSGQLKRSLRA